MLIHREFEAIKINPQPVIRWDTFNFLSENLESFKFKIKEMYTDNETMDNFQASDNFE